MGFVTWIKNVASHVKHAAILVSEGFSKLVGHDNAVNFAHASLDLLKTAAGQLAMEAVHTIESQDPTAPSDQKLAAAVSKLTADAVAQGISLAKNEAHLFIELAVGAMKGLYVPAPAQPASDAAPAADSAASGG